MFTATAPNATTIEVVFTQDLALEGFADLTRFRVSDTSVQSVVPIRTELQTGTNLRVVDLTVAEAPSGVDGLLGVPGFTSNVLAPDVGTFTAGNIGEYIELTTGVNAGVYRIVGVYTSNDDNPSMVIPKETRVLVDRPLIVQDPENGYVNALANIIQASPDPILRLTSVTALNPLVHVLAIENRDTADILDLETLGENPAYTTLVDHNTIQVNEDGPFTFPVALGDRVYVRARTEPVVEWSHTTAVQAVTITTAVKMTGTETYTVSVQGLFTQALEPYAASDSFVMDLANTSRPKVDSVEYLPEDGTVLVVFDQAMRVEDAHLANPSDYVITGPTSVSVKAVHCLDETTVALSTIGFGAGSYTLTVSASTPKDVAGNPLDPLFNSIIFAATVPETVRSIFTDKGPIAKPPEVLQSGINAVLETYNEVTLPGAVLTSGYIGLYVTLSGGAINGGTFRISSVVSPTRVRLSNASFTLPDVDSGTLDWEVFDPRDGQIADDPSDVVVRINSIPVVPLAVVGLLGQILLAVAPGPNDDVKIDYSWCCNPTVEVRRLNSREFRLNSWNSDGVGASKSQHRYRYNNVLVNPAEYDPLDQRASLNQPVSRELHYRAFERAYTATLNDPSLLVLNMPMHQVAFPSSERLLSETFVAYEGTSFPEALIVDAWMKQGLGLVTVGGGFLTVEDNSSGSFPTGHAAYWTKGIDLTFDHVFAMSWRFSLDAVATTEGVFTGVAAGYSDPDVAVVVGYLNDGGVKKIGLLRRGFSSEGDVESWTGGLTVMGAETNDPATLDWEALRSYRIFRDSDGLVSVYVDGDVAPTLRAASTDLPTLAEVNAKFDSLQGVFFGSISRPAESESNWDFVRYLIQPTSPSQTSPLSSVDYEATVLPEVDAKPWTPVGYHGDGTILSGGFLLLDDTSASDVSDVGLVAGDYRGYARFEPLLSTSSEFVVDANVQMLSHTHGTTENGLVIAVDDGTRLAQVAFFPGQASPKLSYGGRSLPEDFSPYVWSVLGGSTASMWGRALRIEDSDLLDGKVYYIEDLEPVVSDDRVVGGTTDYALECRLLVQSYTVDGAGFAGAFAQVYDSTRAVGILLRDVAGTRYVSFHSDGTVISSIAFDWNDGEAHTYRLNKSTGGDLVSLFIDGVFAGSEAYSNFTAPAPNPVGMVSFGSSTPLSSSALSVVDWEFCNAWRTNTARTYVGLWKGENGGSLLGYHLPLKASGVAGVSGNVLTDTNADFVTANVMAGDTLVVDTGANAGIYEVAAVGSANTLTIVGVWPSNPTTGMPYRIVRELDWTTAHQYRLVRDSQGDVSLFFDAETAPVVRVEYEALPPSGSGLVQNLGASLPAIAWGSFDSENLVQSRWGFVRYAVKLSSAISESRIVPHHHVLNQWNVMHSSERLTSVLPHTLTSFHSSSTGHPPKTEPDFLADPGLVAATILNEGTPLVPSTQSFEVRMPTPVEAFVASLSTPGDVLGGAGEAVILDSDIRYTFDVPDDVLYSNLDVIEQLDDGATGLIAPYSDECGVAWGGMQFTKEVCLEYAGDVLPESDIAAPTAWELVSDTPNVVASVLGGVLTYGTDGVGTRTVYRNFSPLPDAPSLQTEVSFRLRVANDASLGTGATQIKFGLSAPGFTVALTFVTTVLGERFVLVLDQNNGNVLGSASHDFLDGAFHDYRLVRDPGAGVVRVFIDS